MLVLNRKAGEAIIIDGGIRIVVLSSDRRGARIGVEAPAESSILREELVRQVAEENRRASTATLAPEMLANLAPLPGSSAPADSS